MGDGKSQTGLLDEIDPAVPAFFHPDTEQGGGETVLDETFRILEIEAEVGKDIHLGRTGENLARRIKFSIRGWEELYGAPGYIQLVAKRPHDPHEYPVAIIREGDNIFWPVMMADVGRPGRGYCSLRYVRDGRIVKSSPFETVIFESGRIGIRSPPPYQSWMDRVLDVEVNAKELTLRASDEAGKAFQAAQKASEEADRATKIAEGIKDISSGMEMSESEVEDLWNSISV